MVVSIDAFVAPTKPVARGDRSVAALHAAIVIIVTEAPTAMYLLAQSSGEFQDDNLKSGSLRESCQKSRAF